MQLLVAPCGQIMLVGSFEGTVDFDPVQGNDVRVAQGRWNGFIWRLDSNGEYLGTTVFGATSPADRFGPGVYAARIDHFGSLVISGNFDGNVDFDPGPTIDSRSSTLSADAFVTKYAADGTYLWTRTFGSTGWDTAIRLEVDATNNVVAAGEFRGTVDFDPGPGVDLHTASIPYATFVTKFNGDGEYAWTRTLQIDGGGVHTPMTVDTSGNVWLSGTFSNIYNNVWIDFDPTSGTDLHEASDIGRIFVTKLHSDGSYGGTYFIVGTESCAVHTVTADLLGGLLFGGQFYGTIDFDPCDRISSVSASQAAFIARYLTAGSFDWVRTWSVPVPGDISPVQIIAISETEFATELGIFREVDLDPGCAVDLRDGQKGTFGGWTARFDSIPWNPDDDSDGVVGLRDFARFSACFSASEAAESPAFCPTGCYNFDFDHDDDIDAADYFAFSADLTGPQ